MAYYNEQLQALQRQVVGKEHLVAKEEALAKRRAELEEEILLLQAIKAREDEDVARLEGRSLAAFFYALTGQKEEKLDKERAEAYAAAVKYDAATAELSSVVEELKAIRRDLRDLLYIEGCYEKLLKEKYEAIKSARSAVAEAIWEREEKLSRLSCRAEALETAMAEGRKADSMADAVLSHLARAEYWGEEDMRPISGRRHKTGSGVIDDIAKHAALDDAQERVEQLQIQLRRFKSEMVDIRLTVGTHIAVGVDMRIADFVFGFLSGNVEVQEHIHQIQSEMNQIKNEIHKVLKKLEGLYEKIDAEREALQNEIDALIVEAEL